MLLRQTVNAMKHGVHVKNLRKLFAVIWNKQFLKFLFFVALSTCFWLFQNLSSSYEMEFEVPVRLVNVPERVVITSQPQTTMRVMLKDHGSVLLQYRYFMNFSPVALDFSQYDQRSGHVAILTRELIKQVSKQLSSTTRITAYRPDTIEYYYNYGAFKRVPVKLRGHIDTDGQMRISGVSLNPDSVSVYALESVLDTISAAYTTAFEINSLRNDTGFSVPVRAVRGAKFIPSQIRTKVYVDMITEKTVQVPVEMVNFPATKALRTFPQKVNVTFQVGASKYNSINADNFVIVVSYDELLNNTSGKFTPRLKTIPAGASHVRISPNEVEFVIEDILSRD